jgi:HEPN domain-containing protein
LYIARDWLLLKIVRINLVMINLEKQIDYWIKGSESNLETSVVLFDNAKSIESLFFCHLAVEKMLKALVVKVTAEIPPRTHDLFRLAEIADLKFSESHISLCQVLMRYQLEGRYPDYQPVTPDKKTALTFLSETKTMVEWIKEKL